jgi:glycosyltransferase involved in cell wall biosynthesis
MGPVRIAVTLEQCWHRVPGGTASSALHAVEALRGRPDLDLVGVSARHRQPPPAPWVPSIPVRPLPMPRLALYESWHGLRRPAVERATGPVDAIYVTGMAMPPPSAPLVVTVHDLSFLQDRAESTRHGRRFFERAIDLARSDATLVACPSQATIEDCVAQGFDRARLRLVPWGIDAPTADEAEVERVRATYRLQMPYVLWVGTIEPRKNLPTLLEAFRRLDRHGLELVLIGPTGWNEDLESHIGSADGRVRTLGFVPEADKRALFAGAELFCLPSLREGFGLPVLEAMAQGVPVITSRGTATEEAAGDAAVLVDPRDAPALTEAMLQVLDSPDEAAAMRSASRRRAAECPWSLTAERLDAVFREAIA